MNDYEKSVYEKFRSENWNKATYDEKMGALQELAVISATHNNNAPSLVKAEYIEGAEFGYYDGTGITVNRYVLESGLFVEHDPETGEMKAPERLDDANIQMMDTIFHEDYHSFQDACINGKIPQEILDGMGISQAQVQEWAANKMNENYVNWDEDYDCYRIQGMEKTAFDAGEKSTKEAFAYLNEKYGEDPVFQKYMESTKEYSFENSLNAAKARFQNPDIERTIQEKMNERYAAVNSGKANDQNLSNGGNKSDPGAERVDHSENGDRSENRNDPDNEKENGGEKEEDSGMDME